MERAQPHTEEYWTKLREVRIFMQEQDQNWFADLTQTLGPKVISDYLRWEADKLIKENPCER